MYLLRQISSPSRSISIFAVYKQIGDRWQYETHFKVENALKFYTWIKDYHFDFKYAIIHLETLYRNTLYYLYPNIKIAVDESAMRYYVRQLLETTPETLEEIAVSMEAQETCLEIELLSFIEGFYCLQNKEEAMRSYAKWQYERPLNNNKLSKFERVMEFYLDEILNYFDLRNIEIVCKPYETN